MAMPAMTLLSGAALAWALATVPGGAQAARSASPKAQAHPTAPPAPAPATRAPSRRKPRIQHAPSPSQESPAQRDRRLARECQGLPNAGACLGYALPRG